MFLPVVSWVAVSLADGGGSFGEGTASRSLAAGPSDVQELAVNEEYNEREDEFDSNPRDDEAPSCAPPSPPPALPGTPSLNASGLCSFANLAAITQPGRLASERLVNDCSGAMP